MFDALTIGSALADIFITSSHFELQKTGDGVFLCQTYGAKIEVDSFTFHTGGGASNVGVGLSRAGLSVASIVELGKDTLAQLVMDDFKHEHVDVQYVINERREQTGGSVILVGHDGGRTVMVHRGASSELDPADISVRAVERASWIHLSSIAGRLPTLQRIGKLAQTHQKKVSWNPGSAELALLASGEFSIKDMPCAVLIMNKEEWEKLAEREAEIRDSVPELIITDGKQGLEVSYEGEAHHVAADTTVAVVDETGAGDAFASGYIAARFHRQPVTTACQWGIRNATAVVQQFGAKPGLLRYAELASTPSSEA
ncbi:carbohydrate kinase family protein [Candidatus Woesebacteria bacterium]|nr:carbohydrate kinase family protein [Candidatus Woesebacteria bacterium]